MSVSQPKQAPQPKSSLLLNALFLTCSILYPILIYRLIQYGQQGIAFVLLMLLILGKAAHQFSQKRVSLAGVLTFSATGILVLALLIHLNSTEKVLLLYPVIINLVLLCSFSFTLLKPPSAVEILARIKEPELPPAAIGYCRKVTVIWSIFFLINATIALWTVYFAALQTWAFYNGMLSYILMAILGCVEYCFRLRFKRQGQA